MRGANSIRFCRLSLPGMRVNDFARKSTLMAERLPVRINRTVGKSQPLCAKTEGMRTMPGPVMLFASRQTPPQKPMEWPAWSPSWEMNRFLIDPQTSLNAIMIVLQRFNLDCCLENENGSGGWGGGGGGGGGTPGGGCKTPKQTSTT